MEAVVYELQVTLEELLRAAGVYSLEEETDIVNAKGRSFRERGCILRVIIHYQNWYSTWMGTRCVHVTVTCTSWLYLLVLLEP